jgi:hypothetical protein
VYRSSNFTPGDSWSDLSKAGVEVELKLLMSPRKNCQPIQARRQVCYEGLTNSVTWYMLCLSKIVAEKIEATYSQGDGATQQPMVENQQYMASRQAHQPGC